MKKSETEVYKVQALAHGGEWITVDSWLTEYDAHQKKARYEKQGERARVVRQLFNLSKEVGEEEEEEYEKESEEESQEHSD